MTDLIKYCHNSQGFKPANWVVERIVLDMHYMLTKEQATMRMLLFGFKEYAMMLEHDILNFHPVIKSSSIDKDKCCGAIEQFGDFINAAKEQRKFSTVFTYIQINLI